MNTIEKLLTQIGLTDTEVEIYRTGLPFSAITVSELAKRTDIQRSTLYHALSTLEQKGLVSKKGIGGKQAFSMSKPDHLKNVVEQKISSLEKKKKTLDAIIPLLAQQTHRTDEKTVVSQYDGIEGIKSVVMEALYCRSRQWDIIAPSKNFFSEFDKAYAKKFMETRLRNGIITRSLWEHDPSRTLLTQVEIRQRNPRFLPRIMHGAFKSVVILFDDKVAIVSSLHEMTAILIQSKEIYATMSAIFEGLWSTSEQYRQK